jgi:hypothetical protein
MPPDSNAWRWSKQIAFRFAFAYFVLYSFPFPFTFGSWYQDRWNDVIPWIGAHIFHLAEPITIQPNGSGDTTWNYVQNACLVAIAAAATIAWSLLDRKRGDYRTLHA